jgi:hypothetical protein
MKISNGMTKATTAEYSISIFNTVIVTLKIIFLESRIASIPSINRKFDRCDRTKRVSTSVIFNTIVHLFFLSLILSSYYVPHHERNSRTRNAFVFGGKFPKINYLADRAIKSIYNPYGTIQYDTGVHFFFCIAGPIVSFCLEDISFDASIVSSQDYKVVV